MNILVTGASGFIAAQIVTDLIIAGHAVTCCVRNVAYTRNLFPTATVIKCDFIRDTRIDVWIERLKDIDIVINCVGILHHPNKNIIWAVHYETPKAIFDACVKTGVKKIIQISALGIDSSHVDYAKSKKDADDYLLTLPISAFILRPSLVYGRGSYGGTSLFRGLAGLPGIIPVPGRGQQEFQPIHLQDLSKAILHLLDLPAKKSEILTAVGPKKISLADLLLHLRAWLGFTKAKIAFIPLWLIRSALWVGNLIPYSVMNSNSYQMLIQNNITNAAETKRFHDTIGFIPRDFTTGLYSQPSTVQDHWHARLYFLKPLLRLSIAFVWIFTAICSLFLYPHAESYQLLEQVGVNTFWQPVMLYGASTLDAIIGIAMLCNYQLKKFCLLQILIIVIYTLIISFRLSDFWLHPFAPIAKNIPLIVAILILLGLESDR